MTRSRVALLAAAALLLIALSVRAAGMAMRASDAGPTSEEVADRPAVVVDALLQTGDGRPGAPFSSPVGDSVYLGSASCGRCHEDAYEDWQRSLHIRMTKPIAEATVLGDFSSGRPFADHGR